MTRIPQPARDAPAAEWAVYADALQEAGDPRGELIALAGRPEELDAHVARHRDALLGVAARHASAFRVTWHHCVADDVEIRITPGDRGVAIVQAFARSPLAEARVVTLTGVPLQDNVELGGAVAFLLENLPATTRVLRFVDERATQTRLLASRDFDPDVNLVDFGNLAPLWRKEQLEEVTFDVADPYQLRLGEMHAPKLERFALRGLRFGQLYEEAALVQTLRGARLPALRSFELRLVEEFLAIIIADRDAYVPVYNEEHLLERVDETDLGERTAEASWDLLRPLFEMLKASPLERLALTSSDDGDRVLDVLAGVGLPPTLRVLDLSDSRLSADWFRANPSVVAGLERLVLERTSLSADDAASLAGLGPAIVHSTGAAPTYRYVVGQE